MQSTKTYPLSFYIIFGSCYVLAAIYAMSYFFQNSALGDKYAWAMRFEAMMDGTARKPFVYRQLVPILTNAVADVSTPSLKESVSKHIKKLQVMPQYSNMRNLMPWFGKTFPNGGATYKRAVASIIIFGFLLGYMALLYALARALFPSDQAIAWFAPIVGVLAFCSFGYQWQYIYDIPVLCLAAACFYLIHQQRWRAYLLIFFLACVNKESSILMLIFFTLWCARRMPVPVFATLWILQAAIFIAVKLILSVNFMKNGGYFLEDNLHLIIARDILGIKNVGHIVLLLCAWFLLTFGWQEKTAFLRCSLWLLPIAYLAYCLYGFPHEYRVFFDIHPPLVLLVTHTLVAGTSIARSPVFHRQRTTAT